MGVSISRKLGAFLRKYKKNFLLRKYKKFFNLRVRKFHFLKCKEFFSEWVFLFFWPLAERYRFQEYKKLFRGFRFLKYEISFSRFPFPEFFSIRVKKFHFLKYKDFFSGRIFFILGGLGWKLRQVSLKYTTNVAIKIDFKKKKKSIQFSTYFDWNVNRILEWQITHYSSNITGIELCFLWF